jgi:hypothetical protein
MRSYARYWLEAFRLPVMPLDRLAGGMRDTGHIRAAFEYLAAERGVVFALPRLGNWDQAAAWIIASGAGSLTAVIERVPEHVRDQVRVECDVGARHLTIVECRPSWREGMGSDGHEFGRSPPIRQGNRPLVTVLARS